MLERAAACVEPASQVFLHRLEPPLRSCRLLNPNFFKNGHNIPETSPWWPLYLNSVRQVPQDRRTARATSRPISRPSDSFARDETSRYQAAKPCAARLRRRPSYRTYSRTANKSVEAGNAEAIVAADDKLDFPGHSLGNSDAGLGQEERLRPAEYMRPVSLAERQLKDLLQAGTFPSAGGGRSLYDEIWELFVALPDQVPFASRVLHHLAASTGPGDMNHALSAFAIIPTEDRSDYDYRIATQVAVRRKRYALVLQICKEAMERGLGDSSRQIGLLSFLRADLYKNAARLWQDCWTQDDVLDCGRYVPSRSLELLDNSTDLPDIFTKLHERLQHADALLSTPDRDCLEGIARGLSWRIVGSGKIMAVVTLEGLLATFDRLDRVQQLNSRHLVQSIQTLNSSRSPRNRHDLAIALYRNLRLRFNNAPVPKMILHGLLYLCYKAREQRQAFTYLLDELRRPYVSWPRGHASQGCPGRDEYIIALRGLAWQGDAEGVEEIYSDFAADHGNPKTTAEVLPALYAYAILGDANGTQKVFDNLESRWGFAPDLLCWNTLMFGYARSDEPHRAFDVLDLMAQHNIKPNAYTYGILVSLCASVGDASTVLSLLGMATQQGIAELGPLLTSLVQVHCLNGEIEKAEEVVMNLDQFKLGESTIRIWNELLRYHAYQSDESAVLDLREKMKDAGVKPDEMTYATVMASLIRTKRTKDALQILRSLHFNSTISATPFLYSLIVHGFQREGNRDMTNALYKEMKQRFPTVSPSAKLSMLRSEQDRGFLKTRQHVARSGQSVGIVLDDALEFLQQFGGYEATDRATKDPQPGFHRRNPREAVPSIYTEAVSEALAMNRKPLQAGELMRWYDETVKPVTDTAENVRILTTRMLVAARQYQRNEVDRLWGQILHAGIRSSVPPLQLRQISFSLATNFAKPEQVMQELIAKLKDADIAILPAQRFALMLPLSRFISTLNEEGRHSELISVMELFPQLGFSITGKNWNHYVQALCNSTDPEHQLLAFSVFEQVLLPNMPSFRLLVKGLWIEPSTERTPGGVPVSRKLLQRLQPGKAVPEYETCVWLTSTMRHFQRMARLSSYQGEEPGSSGTQPTSYYAETLEKRHTEVAWRMSKLPFLKDRVQRILLHQKGPVYGSPIFNQNLDMQDHGITASRSILDQLPVESVDWVSRALASRPQRTAESMATDIRLAEEALGEIVRTPLWLDYEKRWEDESEVHARTQRTELEYLELVERMERNVKQSRLVMNEDVGDPVHQTPWTALTGNDSSSADQKLFKSASNMLRQSGKAPSDASLPKSIPQTPSNLDQHVDPEAKAELLAARARLPRRRVKNTYALFNPLLPPPVSRRVQRAFAGAKAKRRVRLRDIQRAQAAAPTEGDGLDENQKSLATGIDLFVRLRDEQLRLDQEMQKRSSELERVQKEQLSRTSGSMLDGGAPVSENVWRMWPDSFPLVQPVPSQHREMPAMRSTDDARSSPAPPTPEAPEPNWQSTSMSQDEKSAEDDPGKWPSIFSPFGLEDERTHVSHQGAGNDDHGARVEVRTHKKHMSKKEKKRAKAEHLASLREVRGKPDDLEPTESPPGPNEKQESQKHRKENDDGDDSRPFGGWSEGGSGFKF
ncbi:uncharacterized protein HMPREF1541_02632 [Cyphellophora europaea CBS 101466]|uniref:Uncharacterized protein n=1 Tax=Cyphellophora europaea (strain CBS 101466) TaxID=1220924 RepID=W2S618_CYPE1|nr:uncharacterized protein HMPREF1541_02632 [Cyphellophora europaea CBS 101466]ETN43473.1 hypothetical protein HMPREF1541_02632 [Cyphellophora europaea CBS 101466]